MIACQPWKRFRLLVVGLLAFVSVSATGCDQTTALAIFAGLDAVADEIRDNNDDDDDPTTLLDLIEDKWDHIF